MMKKAMLCLLMILSAFLLTACQKQPQPEIKLPELQAAASPAQPEPETAEQTLTLGLIDFDADKELLRSLIQSYNASGAPVRIEMQEAAAQALQAMLEENFQKTIADAFPVSTAVLQEQLQQEIDAQKTYQQTAIREEGRVDVGEAGAQTFLFDEAVAADLMHVLEHVDCRACSNQEILTIILDEADAFFQGRKTAQEAARIMDSRAALFIAEAS